MNICKPSALLLGFKEEIIKRINVHIDGGRSGRQKARPLPSIVLGVQQKVRAHNRYAHGDDHQNDEHQQHESVHIVDFVRPKRCEYKVHFNENRSERQHAAQQYDDGRLHKPFLLRYRTGHGVDATREIRLTVQISTDHRSNQIQRQYDKETNARNSDHRHERNGTRRMIVNGNEIDEKCGATHTGRYEKCGQKHLTNPYATALASVQTAAKVSVHR